jgi:hypothetical protein
MSDPARSDAFEKLDRFAGWVKRTPGLEGLASDDDAILAVAQHYGIPTVFVDFTTEPEVAGFFATDSQELVVGEPSCIICLNTSDLADFWQAMPPKYPAPGFVVIDVSNLWRLQAQSGVFLECPYDAVERIYDFDRIFFPAADAADDATRAHMYPQEKSQLEVLLDQYFMNELLIEGTRNFLNFLNFPINFVQFEADTDTDPDLIAGNLPALASWETSRLGPWLSTYDERLDAVRSGVVIQLDIPAGTDLRSTSQELAANLSDVLRRSDTLREQLVRWECPHQVDGAAEIETSTLVEALTWLWNGLRTLPVSSEDIAAGVGNCVALHIARSQTLQADPEPWLTAAAEVFEDPMEVEFAAADGSYARAYVSADSLVSCVRDDIRDYLTPVYREQVATNATGLLQAVQAPSRLFEFQPLARLFAQQLAPAQVLLRSGRAVYFSPARLYRFGLP